MFFSYRKWLTYQIRIRLFLLSLLLQTGFDGDGLSHPHGALEAAKFGQVASICRF